MKRVTETHGKKRGLLVAGDSYKVALQRNKLNSFHLEGPQVQLSSHLAVMLFCCAVREVANLEHADVAQGKGIGHVQVLKSESVPSRPHSLFSFNDQLSRIFAL